jgi:hypothetical protein
VGSLQLSLEPAISGVRQGDGPPNAGELDGEHQPRAGAGAVSLQSLLESIITTESDIVACVVVR